MRIRLLSARNFSITTGRSTHEIVHTAQQGSTNTLRRQPSGAVKRPELKHFIIKIPAGITTQQQFLIYMEVQLFGRVLNLPDSCAARLSFCWESSAPELDNPAKHIGQPINVDVPVSYFERFGRPEGPSDAKTEKEEAEKAYKGLESEEKEAINLEIDRRYYQSTKETPGTKIKRGETGKAIIWNSLMQEVVADRKKLEELPETVQSLLGQSNFTPENYKILVKLGATLSQLSDSEIKGFFVAGPNGVPITTADYPQLLSIANKLANLPPEARQDYLERVNISTTSLNEMEKSIDNYIRFRTERKEQVEQHEAATKPLLGAEDLYTAYRNYKELKGNVAMARPLKSATQDRASAEESYQYLQEQLRDSEAVLLSILKHKDFDSIAAFEATIESYRITFRTQAVNLALDVLARYDHMLFEERKKLQQPGAAAAIARDIGATKASENYKEYHEQERIASNYQNWRDPKETGWIKPYNEAKRAGAAARASAEREVLSGSGGDPLIKERGIDLEKLAGSDVAGVQSYLTEQINKREAEVKTARDDFNDDPDRIFKLPDLVAATYTLLSVDPGTVYGRIINDYIKDNNHFPIVITILAVALAFLVPGGGWLAAAALVGSAGLSTYQAYQAYKEYQEQERDYELGFLTEEPSLIWVGLAVAAAALDIGVAASVLVKSSATALKALKKPLLDFAKDGDLPTLLAKIEAAEGLDLRLKAALEREARASTAAKEAWKEVLGISMNLGCLGGQASDSGLAKKLGHALYYSIKREINTITKLSADAKFLEIAGDITRMSGAGRAELEVSFEEVKNLVEAGTAKGMDEPSLLNFVDRWAINRGKPGFQTKLLDEMNAWKPLTEKQKKALDALEAQRGVVATLHERKGVVQEELAALRAKADKSVEDVAEIRKLEDELKVLDPKALPARKLPQGMTRRSGEGIGQIAEAELTLEDVEKEAAKAQLSLYQRMRGTKPSEAARERALKRPHVEDLYGPVKTKPKPPEVDHIVSVREICDMDGFADLPLKDQKEIVNMQENLIGMDSSANRSKLDRTWKSWDEASNFYEKSTIEAMAIREADVRNLVQAEIKKRLENLALKP